MFVTVPEWEAIIGEDRHAIVAVTADTLGSGDRGVYEVTIVKTTRSIDGQPVWAYGAEGIRSARPTREAPV